MKKIIFLLLCLSLITALAGCGSSGANGKTGSQPAGVQDVLEQGMAEADGGAEAVKEPAGSGQPEPGGAEPRTPEPAGPAEGIDVDLTVLSSTMVYSEVYNMMSHPSQYIGKTVKMAGLYAYIHDEPTGNDYFCCIIQDATACCAQGIEFVLTDDYVFPDDYPEEGAEVCVVGEFDTYQEGSYRYFTLRNARLCG